MFSLNVAVAETKQNKKPLFCGLFIKSSTLVLGTEPRTLCMLGELPSSPLSL